MDPMNERLTFCQGIPGLECDEVECPACYPPALEFQPADIPPTGAVEPDDYFEGED